jgi:uncharacterized membrane protein YqjE
MIDSGMEENTPPVKRLGSSSRSFARRLLTIGENRLELLTVEVQEERERLLYAFLLALGVSAFGLLAGLTLTAAIAVLLWSWSPFGVLLTLAILYSFAGFYLYRLLIRFLNNWQTFPASLDQLRKDRTCLATILG